MLRDYEKEIEESRGKLRKRKQKKRSKF